MRRSAGPTVSLFPFLTVLLCASGTLIVLLIALSQHVTDAPELAAAPPPAESAPAEPVPPPEPKPPRSPRVVVLPNPRPDRRPEWRAKLAAAEGEAAALAESLTARTTAENSAAAELAGSRDALAAARVALHERRDRTAAAERRTVALREAARRANGEAAELRQQAEAAAAREPEPPALLPVVRTAGGADVAAPALIECTAAGAAFRPSGVTVPSALVGPAADGSSALAAGVRALRERGDADDYVLLLVRPDGLPAFYRAASALDAAGVRFGYELIDAGEEIAWPEADPAQRAALAAAVRAAVETRMIAAARRGELGDDPFGRGPNAVPSADPADRGSPGERNTSTGGSSPGGSGAKAGSLARGGSAIGVPTPGESGPAERQAPAGEEIGAARNTSASRGGRAIPGFTPGTPVDRLTVGPTVRGEPARSPRTPGRPASDRRGSSPVAGSGRGSAGDRLGGANAPAGERGEGGGGGGAAGNGAGENTRIRFAVPVPAALSRGHLWVRGRWVLLPRGEELARVLGGELEAVLADRGAPPAGFRWGPEVKLRVRPDGAADVAVVRAAFEELGAEVTVTAAPFAASEVRGIRR